jgi:hypothetical protein
VPLPAAALAAPVVEPLRPAIAAEPAAVVTGALVLVAGALVLALVPACELTGMGVVALARPALPANGNGVAGAAASGPHAFRIAARLSRGV